MIRFQAPLLPPVERVAAYFEASQERRWYANGGPCHELLVARLRDRVGRGLQCIPLASGTAALQLGARALVGPARGERREVLLPSFTFAAVPNAMVWAGLDPVFVDVDPVTWHVAPETLEAALAERGDRVALVVAASTFGFPPPAEVRDGWRRVTRAAGVPLLVDSAAGFGAAADDGAQLGAQGDAEIFSFHATKPFAVGEGGLLTTIDPRVADRVRRLANFGFENHVVVDDPGLNAKLDEWTAATALAVLDGFDDVLTARRRAAARIVEETTALGFTSQPAAAEGAWQFVPVRAPSAVVRDAVLDAARSSDIEVRTYYHPLHTMPAFVDRTRVGDLESTTTLGRTMLSLPMANDLDDDAGAAIVGCLAAGARGAGVLG